MLLYANRELRILLTSWTLGMTAFWYSITLIALFSSMQYGVAAASFALAAKYLPGSVLAPVESLITDRIPRHLVLVVAAVIGGVTAAALAFLNWQNNLNLGIFYGAVMVLGACRVLVRPATYGLIPTASKTEQELTASNLLRSVLSSTGMFVGPLLAGAVLAWVGATSAFVGLALLLLLQAAFAITLRVRAPLQSHRFTDVRRDTLAGFRSFADRRLRSLLVLNMVVEISTHGVVVAVLFIPVVTAAEHSNDYSYLISALGMGGLLGLSFLTSITRTTSLACTGAIWYAWTFALGTIVLALSEHLVPALLAMATLGLGSVMGNSTTSRQLQKIVSSEVIGRTTGALMCARKLACTLGAGIGGVVTHHFGAQSALLAIAPLLALTTYFHWRYFVELDELAAE
ncbi:MAG: MFS transporter [Pseudomonadota bacterium]